MVAGNWKMHGSRQQIQSLLQGIKQGSQSFSNIDVVVLPSFVYLSEVESVLANTSVMWGAQNFYLGTQGAFTGEVSGAMLVDYGCRYVLVGHSERRALFHEDLELVAAKFKAALAVKLQPILCVGETLKEREKNLTEKVIAAQLDSVIESAGIKSLQEAVIAYEPVWAIGTGLTASPLQAQSVHAFIRERLARLNVDVAQTTRILYGGSVKPENAAELFAMPDIDGGLIGGASLEAKSFLAICKASSNEGLKTCTN